MKLLKKIDHNILSLLGMYAVVLIAMAIKVNLLFNIEYQIMDIPVSGIRYPYIWHDAVYDLRRNRSVSGWYCQSRRCCGIVYDG